MRLLFIIVFVFADLVCYSQQTEEIFRVKKKPKAEQNKMQHIFKLNLDPGHDTICGGLFIDLSPVLPYYDSIACFNLKNMRRFGKDKVSFLTTTIGNGGHAILKFYQKQKDKTYKLIYIRNWVIDCSKTNQ